MACPKSLDKDIAYLIKRKIRDSLTVCRFNQVCRTANLHEVRTLPNGKRHGLWKQYHNDNTLSLNEHLLSEGTYKDGKQHGLWKQYYKNGHLIYKGTYKDGKQHGLWKSYYENRQLKSKSTYKDGKIHGLWKSY